MKLRCTTHFYACDCREEISAKAQSENLLLKSAVKKLMESSKYYAGDGEHRTYLDIFDLIKIENSSVTSFDSEKFASRARSALKEVRETLKGIEV